MIARGGQHATCILRSFALLTRRLTQPAKPEATTTNLASVVEREESPVNETIQSLDAVVSSPMAPPQTPSGSSAFKPPRSEMHPSQFHQTMAAPNSALRLGFTDIKPTANPHNRAAGLQQTTPSKSNAPPSPFTFQSARTNTDLGLGPDAQRIMDELRGEAARIKAELLAKREQERQDDGQVQGRRMAQPKGKAGRYSNVHMEEFKKMDSIANHPSAYRAQPGRLPPATTTKSLKRTQSKANLDDSETPRVKSQAPPRSSTRKTPSSAIQEPDSFASKRARQHIDDDASSNRPVSRDATNIPRPTTAGKDSASGIPRSHSTLASLMTPTKSSLARAASVKTPSVGRSLIRSPSKPALGGLAKSATMHNLQPMETDEEEAPATGRSQRRFAKVKSFFARPKAKAANPKSAIPKPPSGMSQTPGVQRLEKELPPIPSTTPGRRFHKRADFTPETKRAAFTQNSPSPIKLGIPRSKTTNTLVEYPSLDSVMEDPPANSSLYPDLTTYRPLPELPAKHVEAIVDKPAPPLAATPGTFSFRSDHTIRFNSSSPNGFGGNSGQASLRQVRPSIMPASAMPGAFPLGNASSPMLPGKENRPPHQPTFDAKVLPHGIVNKKRARVADDEEDADKEAAERAAKKQKSALVPEGEALVAPRLAQQNRSAFGKFGSPKKSPSKLPRTPGSAMDSPRKRTGMSMSRLNMLARPKNRK